MPPSARVSTVAPTLAPQPPQRMAMAEISLSACRSAKGGSAAGGVAISGSSLNLRMKRRSIQSFQRHTHAPSTTRPLRCRSRGARRSRPDRAPRAGAETAARTCRSRRGGDCRRAPARHARHRRPTSAARGGERDVAGREQVDARHPQRILDSEKALGIERQAGLCQPARRRRLRGPQDLVGSTGARPASMSRPASTAVTAAPVTTSMPRAARMAWKRSRNAAGKVGRMSATSDTRTNDSPPASNPAARPPPQAVLDRAELDAAGAGADQRHARLPCARARGP